jgi:nicotinate-nucleotide pyrophosphorylase (carboxylating)
MDSHLDEIIRYALREDLPDAVDATTDPLIAEGEVARAVVLAKADGILAGIEPARRVFHLLDPKLRFETLKTDGSTLKPSDEILHMNGNLHAILRGERTALNFLCRLSGIATLTAKFVRTVRGLPVAILCTRKTSPGLRELEVQAVKTGGGDCYRANLRDEILIKDNHLALLGSLPGLRRRLTKLSEEAPDIRRKILERGKLEVTSVEELKEGLRLGFKSFLLDNFPVSEVVQAVRAVPPGILLEVSGGVNLNNVRAYAETGVQAISIGALTHSAPTLDLSLEIDGRRS